MENIKVKKKERKLIRANKVKIIIVSLIILIILIGTSVGIFFAVRKEGVLLPKKNISWIKDTKELRKKLESKKTEEVTGVYFNFKNIDTNQLALYGKNEKELENKEKFELSGPFSQYLNYSAINWYGIDFEDENSFDKQIKKLFVNEEKIFVEEGNEPNDESFYEGMKEFDYIGMVDESWAIGGKEGVDSHYDAAIEVNLIKNEEHLVDKNIDSIDLNFNNRGYFHKLVDGGVKELSQSDIDKIKPSLDFNGFLPNNLLMFFKGSDLVLVSQGIDFSEIDDPTAAITDGSSEIEQIKVLVDGEDYSNFYKEIEQYIVDWFYSGKP